jgi:hypothetical protein
MSAAVQVPELSDALHWVNSSPVALAAQQGRVVALVFWHAGSAYCDNLLADMQALQRKHAERLGVFGIHTPKFEAERSARLVLKAVNRLELQFPVALDDSFVAWQHYGIESWPSVLIIDHTGRRARLFVGDLQRDAIDGCIGSLLDRAGAAARLSDAAQLTLKPEPPLPLAFPGGLAVSGNHLYVADTGHHRILECSLEGRVLRQFGTGSPALIDGSSAEACFRLPRGLFLSRDLLYVADTGNHALRRIRLLDGEVDTLIGTGRPGLLDGSTTGAADTLALNAPWKLTGNFDRLYIAMAGAQQIWEFNQGDRSLRVLAGSGQLALADGGGQNCAFAQPADLALVEQTLYVVDSAASAIRSLHLPSGAVHTLVGHGLYEFGQHDGVRSQALMQFPTALAHDARSPLLWIADTYNNTLRQLKLGGGELRHHELNHRLHEPTALAASPGALWIASTNGHEVIRLDLGNSHVRRLPIGE